MHADNNVRGTCFNGSPYSLSHNVLALVCSLLKKCRPPVLQPNTANSWLTTVKEVAPVAQ